MTDTGWFVDETDPRFEEPEGKWIIGLQYPGGVAMLRTGPWFDTEEDALEWMRENVLGQGELEDE